jgi:hypothetical protein
LVAIALSLAMADEALGADDWDRAQELVTRARAELSEPTAELRQLTRGINPVAPSRGYACMGTSFRGRGQVGRWMGSFS